MEISGYQVEIKKDGIKVGCQKISLEDMKELVQKVEQYKRPIEAIYTALKSATSNANNLSNMQRCIEEIRHVSNNFMGIRSSQEYKSKGFYLCRADSDITWKIVEDCSGLLVLVPVEKEPA